MTTMTLEQVRDELRTCVSPLDGYHSPKFYRWADAITAHLAAEAKAVPDYWAATCEEGIVHSYSADDGNNGEAARQELNDWINEHVPSAHLTPLYTHPQPAARDAVSVSDEDVERAKQAAYRVKHGKGSWFACTDLRLRAALESFARGKATDSNWLGELLAVIHGDGGHHQANVGTEQASKEAIDKIGELRIALDKAAQPNTDGMQVGWLIENGKQGSELRYRCMRQGIPEWTDDHIEAIRFCRRVDADMFAEEDPSDCLIIEHAWHDRESPQPAQPSVPVVKLKALVQHAIDHDYLVAQIDIEKLIAEHDSKEGA